MELPKKSKFFEGSDGDVSSDEEFPSQREEVEFTKETEEEILNDINWNRSVYRTARKMKQDPSRNFFNRLKSIQKDKYFLEELLSKTNIKFPVIGNLRCGLWYFPKYDSTCYFKSTDGHVGKWQFNLSRVNMNVVQLAIEHGGCFIVDSTRKGKKYPDSFSRTIPIWSATINRVASILKKETQFPETPLSMPLWISDSEISQVGKLIPSFAQKLLSSGADLSILKDKLLKPLRTYWLSPSSSLDIFFEKLPEFMKENYVIVLISVSEEESTCNTEKEGYSYIQGAGDDEESWANGLTPSLFWQYLSYLLDSGYPDIMKRLDHVLDLYSQTNSQDIHVHSFSDNSQNSFIKIGETGIWIGSSISGLAEASSRFGGILNCSQRSYFGISSLYLHVPVPEGKADKNKIGKILTDAIAFIVENIHKNILIHSASGIHAPVCIAVAALVKHFNLETLKMLEKPRINTSKEDIRKAALIVEKYCPQSRPPKVMMNELNRYFMTPSHLQPKSLRTVTTTKH